MSRWIDLRRWSLLLLLLSPLLAIAQSPGPVRVDAVVVELVSRTTSVRPGQDARLALSLRHDRHWHTYWRTPGDSGLPTRLELSLPDRYSASELEWPLPERIPISPLVNYGYEGDVLLPFTLRVPADAQLGTVRLKARASWLMCRDVCIPGDAELTLDLPVKPTEPADGLLAERFNRVEAQIPRVRRPVSAWAEGGKLSIGVDEPLGSAMFFPYAENLIRHAAAQVLYAYEGSAQRRLEVQLSDEGLAAVSTGDGLVRAASGVLVHDGAAFELVPSAAPLALTGGREIARVAEPVPSQASGSSGSATRPRALFPGLGGGGTLGSGGAGSSGVTVLPPGPSSALGSASTGLMLALGFALLGGLILNLMPCVFPVVGLKVLSFASVIDPRRGLSSQTGGVLLTAARAGVNTPLLPSQHRQIQALSRRRAVFFAAGVLLSFWVLAALLFLLRSLGVAAGWGFQLQSPAFVVAMGLLFVVVGLNFSGVFEVGLSLTRLGQFDPAAGASAGRTNRTQDADGWSSFGSGALAVLVATPCTAPFMGSALGFTLSSSMIEAFAVFTALGLGMASPYLLLGWFPAWLKWLPRPGRWMESLRQLLAFPMYASAAWLAWVLGQQAGGDAVLSFALGAVLVSLACWILGRFVQQRAGGKPWLAVALALVIVVAGMVLAWPQTGPAQSGRASAGSAPLESVPGTAITGWQVWSPERVQAAQSQGRPVFVEFTAAWCVSCQANKKLVLERETVVAAFQSRDVLLLRADWTQQDARITAELARFGRNGVPLYLLYGPDGASPQILPELLTTAMVLQAVQALPAKLAPKSR
jgi:thiol:disulfide interchange protein/DsbC/DsbD-like thiol-disulfide interchange protein